MLVAILRTGLHGRCNRESRSTLSGLRTRSALVLSHRGGLIPPPVQELCTRVGTPGSRALASVAMAMHTPLGEGDSAPTLCEPVHRSRAVCVRLARLLLKISRLDVAQFPRRRLTAFHSAASMPPD